MFLLNVKILTNQNVRYNFFTFFLYVIMCRRFVSSNLWSLHRHYSQVMSDAETSEYQLREPKQSWTNNINRFLGKQILKLFNKIHAKIDALGVKIYLFSMRDVLIKSKTICIKYKLSKLLYQLLVTSEESRVNFNLHICSILIKHTRFKHLLLTVILWFPTNTKLSY